MLGIDYQHEDGEEPEPGADPGVLGGSRTRSTSRPRTARVVRLGGLLTN